MSADSIIDGIIEREGGYVDHEDDRGGCTNYGVTLSTLQRAHGDWDMTCDDPTQAVFAHGWANRLAQFIERRPEA